MGYSWKYDRAKEAIDKRIAEVETVEIVDYKREMSLELIPTNKAYRVDGVHLYADIQNMSDMLSTTEKEGERCHKRTLRFLNLNQRAVHRILARCEALRFDFHNQRLHSLVAKPYGTDEEKKRVYRAVAIGKLAIGFEFGPMTVTRLGMQGDRVRCSVSRGVLSSESEQCRCGGAETAIGQSANDNGSDAVRRASTLLGEFRVSKLVAVPIYLLGRRQRSWRCA